MRLQGCSISLLRPALRPEMLDILSLVLLSGLMKMSSAVTPAPVQSSCFLLHEKGCRMLKVFLELQGGNSCNHQMMISHCPGLCPPCHRREEDIRPECEVDISKDCRTKSELSRSLNPDVEECSDLSFFIQCYQYCTGCDNYWWKKFIHVVEPTSNLVGKREKSKESKLKQKSRKKDLKHVSFKNEPIAINIRDEDTDVEISTSFENLTASDRDPDNLESDDKETEADELSWRTGKQIEIKGRKSLEDTKKKKRKKVTSISDKDSDDDDDSETTTAAVDTDDAVKSKKNPKARVKSSIHKTKYYLPSNYTENLDNLYEISDSDDEKDISVVTQMMPVLGDYDIVKELVESNTDDDEALEETRNNKNKAFDSLDIFNDKRGDLIQDENDLEVPDADRLLPASKPLENVNPTADLLSDMLLDKMQRSGGYQEDTTCIDLFPDCEDYIALAELKHPGIGTCEMKMVKAVCEKSCGYCKRKKTGKDIISDHWLENYINTVKKVYEKLTHNDTHRVLPKTAIEKILNGEPSRVDEHKINNDQIMKLTKSKII